MKRDSQGQFRLGMLILLLLPYAALSLAVEKYDMRAAILAAVIGITGLCTFLHFYRNRRAILEGMLASLLLVALLSVCALIPVVGWIFDVILVLYALGSVMEAFGALIPLVFKALLMWAVFVCALLPELHHPVLSPIGYVLVCLLVTHAMSQKADPYGALILQLASLPLLGIVVASLGKMFQSNVSMGRVGIRQHVSGYTTRAGVQVGDYTRTVMRTVPQVSTSVNANAAIAGSAGVHAARSGDEGSEEA